MNDQNRWEYEVQRHQEQEEFKRSVVSAIGWGVAWTMFLALMWNILAA